MKRPEDGLLFFGESQHLQHFAAEKDVANELFALLTKAKPFISTMLCRVVKVQPLCGRFYKWAPVHRL